MGKYDFDTPDVEVPYDDQRGGISFPSITWKDVGGRNFFFVVDQSNLSKCPKGWVEQSVVFGNGDKPPTDCYVTNRLRCIFLGYRRRWEFEMNDGTTIRLPWGTPSKDWPKEKKGTKSLVQILLHLWQGKPESIEDDISPLILSMNGKGKSNAWYLDPSRTKDRYLSSWPPGILPQLKEETERAKEYAIQKGKSTAAFHWTMWLVDLVPELQDGKALIRRTGEQPNAIACRPVLDLSVGEEVGIKNTRYIGPEIQKMVFEFYERVGKQWEEEWQEASRGVSYGSSDDDGDEFESVGVENDPIPF